MGSQTVEITDCKYYGDTSYTIYQNTNIEKKKKIFINNLMYNLPEGLPQKVVGRDREISEIYNILTTKKTRRIALTGLGGVGKTYLALHCALTWCNQEEGNSFNSSALIHCQSKATFRNSLTGLADKLNISNDQLTLEMIKEIINTYKGKKILFILDDIDSCEIASELFSVQTSRTYVYILATSQNSELQNTFNCYPLSMLDQDDSTQLLANVIDYENLEADALVRVSNFCEGLPLALTQAASCIKDYITYGPENQLNEYIQNCEYQLNQPFPNDFLTSNRKSAYITLKINIERIQHEATKQLLIFLMHLNPTKIDLDMIRCIFGEHADDYLREIKKYSLIYDTQNAQLQYISMSRLLQEVCKIILVPTETDILSLMLVISSDIRYYLQHMDFVTKGFSEDVVSKVLKSATSEDVILICTNIFYNSTIPKRIEKTLEDAGCENLDYKNWPDLVIASAIGFYNKEVTDVVLSKIAETCGNNMNISGNDGITPLHTACGARGGHIVNSLLKMEVSCNIATANGVKPIHIACTAGKKFDVVRLLENNVDVNEIGPNDNIPLHLATRKLNWYLVPILCKYGAHVNHQNDEGNTPLHVAAKVPYEEYRTKATVNELFAAGAKATITNNNKDTPLDVAKENTSSDKIAKYIRNPKKPLSLLKRCIS